MIKKILIANRGEIAVRIIRGCRELGIKTVAVHSTADKDSLHAKLADESICIGPGSSAKSYLSVPQVMSAAEITGVDAIHPGYGFLAENYQFAQVCQEYGIKFIGPLPKHIRSLGDKIAAKEIAKKVNIPLLPGSKDSCQSFEEASDLAKQIGYPIIIKAVAGGGGRGMKIVYSEGELLEKFQLAKNEASTFFGNPAVYIEKYLLKPRHVEIQLIADSYGKIIHCGERDCSIQRRHQKLIEEAPCPAICSHKRNEMGELAKNLVQFIGYESVATVEFLLDSDGNYYFIEVNTRIQVEHPVTEVVTGIDLIKTQIAIAAGEKLPISQKDIKIFGHAIECRINAEDPKTFVPWPGKITAYYEPGGPGIRLDSMIYAGCQIPPLYDSLIAKLIAFGGTRSEAIARMRRALYEMKIDGIRTNIDFHYQIMSDPHFIDGDISTKFLDT